MLVVTIILGVLTAIALAVPYLVLMEHIRLHRPDQQIMKRQKEECDQLCVALLRLPDVERVTTVAGQNGE